MAQALADLVTPAHTAVITMEMQRGVCGDLATMPVIAQAVDQHRVIPATAALLHAARHSSVVVVHCTFSLMADRVGTPMNAPLIRMLARRPEHLLHGSAATELHLRLNSAPTDIFSNRHHGFSPFTGTDLHDLLSRRGVTTVVVAGVSLNLGIPGTVIEAVNLGYHVVVASDCVVGMPDDYGAAMISNTLALVATIASSVQIAESWV